MRSLRRWSFSASAFQTVWAGTAGVEVVYVLDMFPVVEREDGAVVAQTIKSRLVQAGLYRPGTPATRLIVAYCLYWWRAFTLGYALEVEIQQDLEASDIQFQAHDLRRPKERLSPYDLVVLGFEGDIKTSTYFLHAARTRRLPHDFYITRVRGRRRTRTLVVFMQAEMWEAIDGETLLVLLEQIADTLPQAARIVHEEVELTVIDYETWKVKVRSLQRRSTRNKEEGNGSTND